MSDIETALVAELRAFSQGASHEDQHFVIEYGGFRMATTYTSGSSSNLVLAARYDAAASGGMIRAIRPMSITLRKETHEDVDAKESGVSREHQTGDAEFDRAVYIDTPTFDVVLRQVLTHDVREGARKLLVDLGFRQIVLDDHQGHVEATLIEFTKASKHDGRAKAIVDAFARMLRGLPAVTASAGGHPAKPLAWITPLAALLTIASVIGAPLLFFEVAGRHNCTESGDEGTSLKDGCGGPAAFGLVCGLGAAILTHVVVRAFLRKAMAGHSDSSSRVATHAWMATVIAFALVFLGTASAGYASW